MYRYLISKAYYNELIKAGLVKDEQIISYLNANRGLNRQITRLTIGQGKVS